MKKSDARSPRETWPPKFGKLKEEVCGPIVSLPPDLEAHAWLRVWKGVSNSRLLGARENV